jgi:hypothetical protein
MSDGDFVDTSDKWNQAAFFWVGLFGIVATGTIVGVGGDNYWAVAHAFDSPSTISRGAGLLGAFAFVVGLCDLVALGVMFAGTVILVQRIRGVSGED